MHVEVYEGLRKELWDQFIRQSKNGTFLFLRDYMDYHTERFTDHSLLFFKDKRLSFTALLDPRGEAGKEFGINSIPTTIILDKNGNIIAGAIGPRDWGSRQAHTLFQHLVDI